MIPSNILLLSTDPLLEMVIRHFLPAGQYSVIRGDDPAEVASQLEQGARLAILDTPDVQPDVLAFIRELNARAGKPLIVLVPDPEQLAGQLEPAVRLLPRPPQLSQLQAALLAALAEPGPGTAAGADPRPITGWRKARRRAVGILGGLLLVGVAVLLLGPFVGPLIGIQNMPNVIKWALGNKEDEKKDESFAVKLLPGRLDAFELAPEVAEKMKLNVPKAVEVIKPIAETRKRTLTLSGTLAFNTDRLARIQSRFPGEVIALGTLKRQPIDEERQSPLARFLQVKDRVEKGHPLAVVWCKDLGEKKSELVEALSRLSADRVDLRQIEKLYAEGAAQLSALRAAERNVSLSLSAVNKAERTLRTWRVSGKEIDAVKEEAKGIIERKEKLDPKRVKDWARVEIDSPIGGVIVEKNVVPGNIFDTTQDLFKIADLSELAVYAHIYEEDQRELQELKEQRYPNSLIPWRVFLTSDPKQVNLKSDGIKRLGLIVDPQQHTNFAMGLVLNKGNNLTVGQFVTAQVDIPAPPDVVSIPVGALDEDGDTSHVLVQIEAKGFRYELRRVRVVRRFLDFAYVKTKLDDSDRASEIQVLKPGDRVVTGGAVQLRAALEEARAREKHKK